MFSILRMLCKCDYGGSETETEKYKNSVGKFPELRCFRSLIFEWIIKEIFGLFTKLD